MAPRVIITKFPFENSNDESKDEIQTNSNDESKDENQKNSNDDSKDRIQTKRRYLCLLFDMHCQLKAKLRKLDQLRSKVQRHSKNRSQMSRTHHLRPFFYKG